MPSLEVLYCLLKIGKFQISLTLNKDTMCQFRRCTEIAVESVKHKFLGVAGRQTRWPEYSNR